MRSPTVCRSHCRVWSAFRSRRIVQLVRKNGPKGACPLWAFFGAIGEDEEEEGEMKTTDTHAGACEPEYFMRDGKLTRLTFIKGCLLYTSRCV